MWLYFSESLALLAVSMVLVGVTCSSSVVTFTVMFSVAKYEYCSIPPSSEIRLVFF